MSDRYPTPQTNEEIRDEHGIREMIDTAQGALESGNISLAARIADRFTEKILQDEQAQAIIHVLEILREGPDAAEADEYVYNDALVGYTGRAIIAAFKRDKTLRGVVGMKKREENVRNGITFLQHVSEVRGDNSPVDASELDRVVEGDISTDTQITIVENSLSLPNADHRTLYEKTRDKLGL